MQPLVWPRGGSGLASPGKCGQLGEVCVGLPWRVGLSEGATGSGWRGPCCLLLWSCESPPFTDDSIPRHREV